MNTVKRFILSIFYLIKFSYAPKITGMIVELPQDNLRYLVGEENLKHLEDLVKSAYVVNYFF